MDKIILLTTNERKQKSLQHAFDNAKVDLQLEISSIWLPEIQATDTDEVACFAAEYCANQLQQPVIKMDSGFFIKALGDFPGPFVHYADIQVGADKFFDLLRDIKDQSAYIKNSLAYCNPGQKPIVFSSQTNGWVSDKILEGEGSFIGRMFIPKHPHNPDRLFMEEIKKRDYNLFLEMWGNAEEQFINWWKKHGKDS